jgi:hypothetical protein
MRWQPSTARADRFAQRPGIRLTIELEKIRGTLVGVAQRSIDQRCGQGGSGERSVRHPMGEVVRNGDAALGCRVSTQSVSYVGWASRGENVDCRAWEVLGAVREVERAGTKEKGRNAIPFPSSRRKKLYLNSQSREKGVCSAGLHRLFGLRAEARRPPWLPDIMSQCLVQLVSALADRAGARCKIAGPDRASIKIAFTRTNGSWEMGNVCAGCQGIPSEDKEGITTGKAQHQFGRKRA